MRRNKNDIIRLQSIIENDRVNSSANFTNLLLSDLNNLLREFFDFKEAPDLNIERSGGSFVQINFTASRIKNFIDVEQQ